MEEKKVYTFWKPLMIFMSSIKLKELLLNNSFAAISLLFKKNYLFQVFPLLMTQGFLIDSSQCHKQQCLHFLNIEITFH